MKNKSIRTAKRAAKRKALKLQQSGKGESMFASKQIRVFMLMSMPNPNYRAVAVLDVPDRLNDKIDKIGTVKTKCNATTQVTFPAGELSGLDAEITILDAKKLDVKNNVSGAVAARNAAIKNTVLYIRTILMPTVQKAADANANNAISIIESCDFRVKLVTKAEKPPFGVYYTLQSGELKFVLNVKAMLAPLPPGSKILQSALYMASIDGIHWEVVEGTYGAKSKITVGGFSVGTTIQFKARGTFSKGRQSAWVLSGPILIK